MLVLYNPVGSVKWECIWGFKLSVQNLNVLRIMTDLWNKLHTASNTAYKQCSVCPLLQKSHSLPGRNFSTTISFFLASNYGLLSHEWYQSFNEKVHHWYNNRQFNLKKESSSCCILSCENSWNNHPVFVTQ